MKRLVQLTAAGTVALALATVAGASKIPPGPERISAAFTIKNPRGSTLTCFDGATAYTRTYGDYRGPITGSFAGTVRIRATSYVSKSGVGWIDGASLSTDPGKPGTGRRVVLTVNAIVDGRRATGFAYGQVTNPAGGKTGGKQQVFAVVTFDLDQRGITGGEIGPPGSTRAAQAIVYPQACNIKK